MKKVRRIYKESKDLFCDEVLNRIGGRFSFKTPEGGMPVWVRFKEVNTKFVSRIAQEHGLYLNAEKMHNTAPQDHNAICMGFASMNTDELKQALDLFELGTVKAVQSTAQKRELMIARDVVNKKLFNLKWVQLLAKFIGWAIFFSADSGLGHHSEKQYKTNNINLL